jgi:hypothetical protein
LQSFFYLCFEHFAMKKVIVSIAAFLLFFAAPSFINTASAFGPPGPPTGPPPCWPPPCTVPLDGGISLLIAAGVAYGGKKLYDNRNKKNPA